MCCTTKMKTKYPMAILMNSIQEKLNKPNADINEQCNNKKNISTTHNNVHITKQYNNNKPTANDYKGHNMRDQILSTDTDKIPTH